MSKANQPEQRTVQANHVDQLLTEHRPRLAGNLRAAFPWMQPDQMDDWLQHLATVMLEAEVPLDVLPKLWKALKHDVLDSLKRHELTSLESLASGTADDPASAGFQPPHPHGWSPASLAAEKERLERRERLLSDVLRDYVAECESAGAWRERELMERLLRLSNGDPNQPALQDVGRSREHAAKAMGISMNQLYVTSKKGRERLQKLMQQKDIQQSVFVTFFGQPRDKRPLPDGVVPEHQASIVELIRWLIETAGAMCPTDARLMEFAAAGANARAEDSTAYGDVRYHVDEAQCVLCRVTLSVLNATTEESPT